MTGWLGYALLTAAAAGATAILAKLGVEGVPSNLATAIRTTVVLVFAWGIAAATGDARASANLGARTLAYLTASGVATGVSWLAYFRALQLGPASRVAPIDKLSLPIAVALAALLLGEPIGWRVGLGVALMVVGSLLTLG